MRRLFAQAALACVGLACGPLGTTPDCSKPDSGCGVDKFSVVDGAAEVSVEPDATGLDAAGLDAAGLDAAGLDAAGLDAAGDTTREATAADAPGE